MVMMPGGGEVEALRSNYLYLPIYYQEGRGEPTPAARADWWRPGSPSGQFIVLPPNWMVR
jgi:hypothetical protein